jgi:hypothetical protein
MRDFRARENLILDPVFSRTPVAAQQKTVKHCRPGRLSRKPFIRNGLNESCDFVSRWLSLSECFYRPHHARVRHFAAALERVAKIVCSDT